MSAPDLARGQIVPLDSRPNTAVSASGDGYRLPYGRVDRPESRATDPGARPNRAEPLNRLGSYAFVGYLVFATLLLLAPLDIDSATGIAQDFQALAGIRLSTLGHVVLYAVGSLVGSLSPGALPSRLVLLAIHGPLMEILQGCVGYRSAELTDAIADWTGLGLGTAIVLTLSALRLRQR